MWLIFFYFCFQHQDTILTAEKNFAKKMERSSGVTSPKWHECPRCRFFFDCQTAPTYDVRPQDIPDDQVKCEVNLEIKLEEEDQETSGKFPCTNCSTNLLSETERDQHMDEHRKMFLENYTNRERCCYVCAKLFENASEKKRHIATTHKRQDCLQCLGCQKQFVSTPTSKAVNRLRQHLRNCSAVDRKTESDPWTDSNKDETCPQMSHNEFVLQENMEHKYSALNESDYFPTLGFNSAGRENDVEYGVNYQLTSSEKDPEKNPLPGEMIDETSGTGESRTKVMSKIMPSITSTYLPISKTGKSANKRDLLRPSIRRNVFRKRNIIACSNCERLFKNLDELKRHKLEFGNKCEKQLFTCCICEKSYGNRTYLRRHMAFHSKANTRTCLKCNKTFPNTNRLKHHLKRHCSNNKPKIMCPKCGKSFKTRSYFETHLATHYKKKSIPCPLCGKLYKNESYIEKHIKYIHQKIGLGNFRCPHCPDKVYRFKSGLKNHLDKSHSEAGRQLDYTYLCRICPFKTFFKVTYEHHFVDVHRGENPYKCVSCEATFLSEMSRQEHVQMYHPEMEGSSIVFKCSMCSRVYYSQKQYENHVRKSHKLGNFECRTCNKTFTTGRTF